MNDPVMRLPYYNKDKDLNASHHYVIYTVMSITDTHYQFQNTKASIMWINYWAIKMYALVV